MDYHREGHDGAIVTGISGTPASDMLPTKARNHTIAMLLRGMATN